MPDDGPALTRRGFLGLTGIAGAASLALPGLAAETVSHPAPAAPAAPVVTPPVPDEFPTQTPALAREMVGVSHGNLARVRELLVLHATLANASWDWGFGDWESALGAAAHMGNREIAEALLVSGARPSIFSATMLGHLPVVRAFVEAAPGIQATLGPHGITLAAHARAGGPKAALVLQYLIEVGGADPAPSTVDLLPEAAARYAGVYAFGPRATDRIEITVDKGAVRFTRTGMTARNLLHRGEHAFSPAGAPAVRVRFTVAGDAVSELAVYDPDLILRARRIS